MDKLWVFVKDFMVDGVFRVCGWFCIGFSTGFA